MNNYTTITDQARKVWTDDNGWLRIDGVELTRETVNRYLGRELDPYGKQGLDPNKVYTVYRSPESIEGSIEDFTTIDVSNEHEMDEPENHIESKGSVSSAEIVYENGQSVIRGDVVIKDKPNIEAIGKKILNAFSVGYKSVLEFINGTTPWGEPYDIKILKIIPNHLKLTDNPRVKTATITDEDFCKFDIFPEIDNNTDIQNKKDFDMKFSQFKNILKKKTSLKDEEIQEIEKEMKDADYTSRFRAALQTAGMDDEIIEKIMTALNPIIEDIKSEDADVEKATAEEEEKEVVDESEENKDKKEDKPEDKLDIEKVKDEAREEGRTEAKKKLEELAEAKEEVKDCIGNAKVGDSVPEIFKSGCKALGINIENMKDEDFKPAFRAVKSMRGKDVTVSVKDDNKVDLGVKKVMDNLNKITTK